MDVLYTDVATVRETQVMTDPLYGLTASAGFHVLKDRWTQKSHFGIQSQHLTENFATAIAATEALLTSGTGHSLISGSE